MTRQLFPSERVLLGVSQQAGSAAVSLAGGFRTIYSDPAHTFLADITYPDGSAVTGSRLPIDNLSRLPLFLGPSGADVVYDDAGNDYFPVTGLPGPTGLAGPQGTPGTIGPVGPQGPSGASSANYVVSVGSASSIWEGDHPLGFRPAGVSVQDQTGVFRFGFVVEILNTTHYRINVGAPKIGQLTLS